MEKYVIVQTVKETYEIKADSKDEALRKLQDGERVFVPVLVESVDLEVK